MKIKLPTFLVLLLLLLTPVIIRAQNGVKLAADSSSTIVDTLLFKIQTAQSAVNEIDAYNGKPKDIDRIRKDFNALQNDLKPVKEDLEDSSKAIDKKSLLSYQLLLKDASEKLERWQNALSKQNGDLQNWLKQIVVLSQDSLLKKSAMNLKSEALYKSQIAALRLRLHNSGATTNLQLDSVSRLLASVTAGLSLVTDLQHNTTDRLRNTGLKEVGKEAPYLWSASPAKSGSTIGKMLSSSYQAQYKILVYFIRTTWDNRTLLLLVGACFFFWIRSNFKNPFAADKKHLIGAPGYIYIKPLPIMATLILILTLCPLFEPDAPAFYIELIQFCLLLLLSFLFWKKIEKRALRLWFIAIGLQVIITLARVMMNDALRMRFALLLINFGSIFYGIAVSRYLKGATFASRPLRTVPVIYVSLNFLAILFNIFGRITLAGIFSITAIIGLSQVIVLVVFVQIAIESMDLQIKISTSSNGLFSRINVPKARASVKEFFSWLSILLWWLVFFINLGIASALIQLLTSILSKHRVFGSIKFSLGNLLFFMLIIYVTNLLQKYVALLFGDSKLRFEEQVEHKGSKIALIRLTIIVIGFLMALSASGVPIDKLTVVLGAFGVGVGLGMQNIVTNFLSGIILIFEKPFRIGDYIELAEKKGKVQDIGIRSSRMITAQGSYVIIPNGDLLSGRLVNWTLHNDYIKTEVTFKVASNENLDRLNKIIEAALVKLSDSMVGKLKPEILLNAIAADSIELKVMVWINNIYIEAAFKSDLLKLLLLRFNEAGVKIL